MMYSTAVTKALTGAIMFVLLATSQVGVFSYPVSAFNVKQWLKESTIVAKIQVLSTKEVGTCLDPRFHGTKPVLRCLTHVKRLAEIKGHVSEEFDIAYPTFNRVIFGAWYPSLAKNEICVVFLIARPFIELLALWFAEMMCCSLVLNISGVCS